jgi:hypothetical protein
MLAAFFAIALIELFVVHLLVSLWSTTAAWILSALTLLGLIQIGLLIDGMIRWPTRIGGTSLDVRHGRLGELVVPLDQIASVEDVAFRPEQKGPQVFRATVLAQPNVAIKLAPPLPYRRRMLEWITLRLDEPELFRAEIGRRLAMEPPHLPV